MDWTQHLMMIHHCQCWTRKTNVFRVTLCLARLSLSPVNARHHRPHQGGRDDARGQLLALPAGLQPENVDGVYVYEGGRDGRFDGLMFWQGTTTHVLPLLPLLVMGVYCPNVAEERP